MVERFSVPSKGRGHPVVLLRRPNDGEFVRYSDYAELEAENERLTKERDEAKRINAESCRALGTAAFCSAIDALRAALAAAKRART